MNEKNAAQQKYSFKNNEACNSQIYRSDLAQSNVIVIKCPSDIQAANILIEKI
jgi:hypothetical protein